MRRLKAIHGLAFLLMGAILLFLGGCAEDENPVTPSSPLVISVGGSSSLEVPFNAYVTYTWSASGGSGIYTTYTYQLEGVDASAQTSVETSKTYYNLPQGSHVFTVTVTDNAGTTATATKTTVVLADAAVPVIEITQGPIAGSQVAETNSVAMMWTGGDPNSYFGAIADYSYELRRDDSVQVASASHVVATSATFDSLQVGHHVFTVTAYDNGGLTASDTLEFDVIPANIIWMDNQDMGSVYDEFVQKQEWVAALNGFAWKEFDVVNNYTSTSTALAAVLEEVVNSPGSPVSTIIWDDEEAPNSMLWYSSNGVGARTPWLWNFINRGGNLVLIGSDIMDQVYNSVPPVAGDFECEYMGIIADSTLMTITADTTYETVYDSAFGGYITVTIVTYDTTYTDAWVNDSYTTLTGENGYTNILIDVAKDPATTQGDYLYYTLNSAEVKPIMLDDDTGAITSYVVSTGKGGKLVVLGMNLYFSPTAQIRDVMQKILKDEFEL